MRYTGSGYATTDPTAVSIQLLAVFGAAPLSAFIAYQIVKGDPTRYYWTIVLGTAELYGGYVPPCFPSYASPLGHQAKETNKDMRAPFQMDDVLPRMAHWKPGPQYIGRARHLGIPCRESLFANLLPPLWI
jgi:hypothetical protein